MHRENLGLWSKLPNSICIGNGSVLYKVKLMALTKTLYCHIFVTIYFGIKVKDQGSLLGLILTHVEAKKVTLKKQGQYC